MSLDTMIDPDRVLVEVSNKHIHLSRDHVDVLYGKGYELKLDFNLSQPGQYAARERVWVYNPASDRWLQESVRILGPTRKNTQLEISNTESIKLKVNAPTRLSGNIEGTPGLRIYRFDKQKYVDLESGVIVAKPHIHINYEDAAQIGVESGQYIDIKVEGAKPKTFHEVVVRTGPSEKVGLAVHVDTDEGNSVHADAGPDGRIYGKIIIP